ncbi:hypothetical protein KCH_53430 [Kitasatospora cheerisanensis KCTC 2395]|uniref:Uncharacterized protein n=1 Tax=Kitasatospora cheerisanensis KCTC 2395 TaxID=1348663 RepID=A0A066YY69_9ACTN|nr:hypothetical protein KCH_53430 [Kitasatospora cheerisanensis KCTC 2395]
MRHAQPDRADGAEEYRPRRRRRCGRGSRLLGRGLLRWGLLGGGFGRRSGGGGLLRGCLLGRPGLAGACGGASGRSCGHGRQPTGAPRPRTCAGALRRVAPQTRRQRPVNHPHGRR